MNKEYFESIGWKFNSEFRGVIQFQRGDIWKDNGAGAFIDFDTNTSKLLIITTDIGFNVNGPNTSTKFNGRCDSPETFKLICDLIELKV